jgi:hypothetical protein
MEQLMLAGHRVITLPGADIMRRASLLLLVLLAACQDSLSPENERYPSSSTSGENPIIAPLDTAYVPQVPGDTSVWAVKGQGLTVLLRFGGSGDQLLEFKLDPGSLSRRPDGSQIEVGDSVLITIRPHGQLMRFEFEPSGLVFDGKHPALLRMWCTHAAEDLNGDGVVNRTDEQLWYRMKIWKQESPTDPWTSLNTTRSPDGDELEAEVGGFTGFSVAS